MSYFQVLKCKVMKRQLYINELRNMTRYLKAHMSLLFSRLLKGGHVYTYACI